MKFFLIVALFLALSAPALSQAELKPLPALRLQDFDGKAVNSEQFKGNILIVDFWATWCGPCIAEIPTFNRLEAQYAEKGVKVLGVTLMSGEAGEVKPFLTKHKMMYTVVMGDDDQAYDLNIMGFPMTYLLTRDWKVYKKYLGAGPRKAEQIEADIKALLEMDAKAGSANR